MKKYILCLLLILPYFNLFSEGTQQWIPAGGAAGQEMSLMLYNGADGNGRLGTTGCLPEERIYIAVSGNFAQERIYIGMNVLANTNSRFRVMDPAGNQVYPATAGNLQRVLSAATGNIGEGYIPSLNAAQNGPREVFGAGGFDAISITPTMAGNYYIEFNGANSTNFTNTGRHQVSYFDVTVANTNGLAEGLGNHTAIDGRLHSYQWGLYNLTAGFGFNNIDATYYVYHPTDSAVMSLVWDNVRPGGWDIAFTQRGLTNTGDLNADRQSRPYSVVNKGTVTGDFPIFWNDPDPSLFPSATVEPDLKLFEYNVCLGSTCFLYETTKSGQIEVLLDFNNNGVFDDNTRDRILVDQKPAGTHCMAWDGLDGLGNPVVLGTTNIDVKYQAGLMHMPLGDVEGNPNGFAVNRVRPAFLGLTPGLIYYDHSQAGGGFNATDFDFTGCATGCNVWPANDGDSRYLNTWFSFAEISKTYLVNFEEDCDNDKDAILDAVDIDDDNDGIPDLIETICDNPTAFFVGNPDAYWRLDSRTRDASGNRHHQNSGTNRPQFINNSIEGAGSANFNGTNDVIRYSEDGGFMEVATNELTIAMWIKPNSLTGEQTLFEEGGITNGIALRLNGNTLEGGVRTGGAGSEVKITHPVNLSLDAIWHHVALTFENGTLILFYDGIPSDPQVAGFTTIAAHSSDGGIGATIAGDAFGVSGDVNHYSGQMDGVTYYGSDALRPMHIAYEATRFCDADGDGIPNHYDLDSDNDGIPDLVEALGTDTNGDGVIDDLRDRDSDGLLDVYDTNDEDGPTGTNQCLTQPTCALGRSTSLLFDRNADGINETVPNNDADALPNYLDLDSDNDGIQDLIEAGGADTNGDGLVDNYNPTTGKFIGVLDTDNDGFSNIYDNDTDNNNVADDANPLLRTGADTDNDGLPNSYPFGNADQHGLPNFIDKDSDNDGITDVVENAEGMTSGNENSDAVGGSILDGEINEGGILDLNGNGWQDLVEGTTTLVDSDMDGVADVYDIDADNDGIQDAFEGTCTLCPAFGISKGLDSDNDGILDVHEGLQADNTLGGTNKGRRPNEDDNDGTLPPDYLDTDSDNDAAPDWAEGYDTNGDRESGDEIIALAADYLANGGPATDYPSTDTDGDGLPDWLDNLNGYGYTSADRPPFLNPSSSFWVDRDNDGLVDIFDNNIAGQTYAGTLAALPDNGSSGERDWRDFDFRADLPIELVVFTANKQNNATQLDWSTASEINSAYFIIEHSVDGLNFEAIGQVAAAGESVTQMHYEFLHNNPAIGYNYYRLKMVDQDETFEYSNLQAVYFEDLQTARLYPNPATDYTVVELENAVEQATELSIHNKLGQLVKQLTLTEGTRRVELTTTDLPQGTYTVRIYTEGKPKILQLMVVRS